MATKSEPLARATAGIVKDHELCPRGRGFDHLSSSESKNEQAGEAGEDDFDAP